MVENLERLTLSLTLSLDAGPDADDESRAELTQSLRRQLLASDVGRIQVVRSGVAPRGAKGDPVSLSTVAITLAPVAFKTLVDFVQGWLSRHQQTGLTIEYGGRKLVVSGNLSKQQRKELLAAFLGDRESEEP